jgi:hypothetical protein
MQLPGQFGLGALWPPVISQRLQNSESRLSHPIHAGTFPLSPLQRLGRLTEAGRQLINLPEVALFGGFNVRFCRLCNALGRFRFATNLTHVAMMPREGKNPELQKDSTPNHSPPQHSRFPRINRYNADSQRHSPHFPNRQRTSLSSKHCRTLFQSLRDSPPDSAGNLVNLGKKCRFFRKFGPCLADGKKTGVPPENPDRPPPLHGASCSLPLATPATPSTSRFGA